MAGAQDGYLARCALLAIVLSSCLLFTGIIFGWAPMVLLLKEEGFYASVCPEEVHSCAQQDDKLNLVYTLASTTVSLVGLPAGVILDQFGAPTTTIVATIFEVIGLSMIATSDTEGNLSWHGVTVPEAFVAGVLSISVGGSLYMFAAFHSTFMWPEYQPIVMAGISCLFDGSTVVFATMYYMHQTLQLSRQELFSGFAVFTVFLSALLLLLWALNAKLQGAVGEAEDLTEPLVVTEDAQHATSRDSPSAVSGIRRNSLTPTGSFSFPDPEREATQSPSTSTFWQQVKTFNFVFIFFFCSSHIVRSNFYLGTANLMLDHLGDSSTGNHYTKVTGYIIPCGFAVIPFIGFAVDKLGIVGSCQLVNVLGVMYNTGSLIPNLPTQLYTAAVYTTYRAFVFSVIATYNAQVFGMQTMGRIQGLLFLVAALLNLGMNPIVSYTNERLDEDYFWPIVVQILLLAPLIVLTEIVRWRFRRQAKDDSVPVNNSVA